MPTFTFIHVYIYIYIYIYIYMYIDVYKSEYHILVFLTYPYFATHVQVTLKRHVVNFRTHYYVQMIMIIKNIHEKQCVN